MTTERTDTGAGILASGTLSGTWTLDPARSTASITGKSFWGMVKVNGTFATLAGEGTVTAAGEVAGRLSVDSSSVDTKLAVRDEHLRSAHFLDSGSHQHISFTLEKAEPSGDGFTVSGTLTVRGQSRPVSFPATVTSGEDSTAAVDATLRVDRTEFGMTYSPLPRMVSPLVDATVHAVFRRT